MTSAIHRPSASEQKGGSGNASVRMAAFLATVGGTPSGAG